MVGRLLIAIYISQHRTGERSMTNEIGNVKGITGSSTALNGQAGQGAVKPSASGNTSPGGTQPPKPGEASVPMPK
jgi:hypothetical protein